MNTDPCRLVIGVAVLFLSTRLCCYSEDQSGVLGKAVFVDGFSAGGETARYEVPLDSLLTSPSWCPELEAFPVDLRALAVKALSSLPGAHEFLQNRAPSTQFNLFTLTIKRVKFFERQLHPAGRLGSQVTNKWAVAFTFHGVDLLARGSGLSVPMKRVVLLLDGHAASETIKSLAHATSKDATNSTYSWPGLMAEPKITGTNSPESLPRSERSGLHWKPTLDPFPLDLSSATCRSKAYVLDRFHTIGELNLADIRISAVSRPLPLGTVLAEEEFRRRLETNDWIVTFTFVDSKMSFSDVRMSLDGKITSE